MSTLKRILLAEDDPQDVELTVGALAEYHLANEIVVVRDGVEALDYVYRREAFADRPAENPAVIMTDLKMPRLDGLQVLKQLKADQVLRLFPVVALTSSRDDHDLAECYRLGRQYLRRETGALHRICGSRQGAVFWALINEPLPSSRQRLPARQPLSGDRKD